MLLFLCGLFGLICGLSSYIYLRYCCKNNDYRHFIVGWMLAILSGVFMIESVFLASTKDSLDTTYYLPAEIVSYNDTCVYFETPNNILYIEMNGANYPDTVPYLLHMDSMGTDDILDDEIIVVWRCSE